MRKTISFTISLSFILLFFYCKNEKQLDERKFKIESITNQAKAIFSKSSTDIDGYRLGMNKDSLQNALFKCLADSVNIPD